MKKIVVAVAVFFMALNMAFSEGTYLGEDVYLFDLYDQDAFTDAVVTFFPVAAVPSIAVVDDMGPNWSTVVPPDHGVLSGFDMLICRAGGKWVLLIDSYRRLNVEDWNRLLKELRSSGRVLYYRSFYDVLDAAEDFGDLLKRAGIKYKTPEEEKDALF